MAILCIKLLLNHLYHILKSEKDEKLYVGTAKDLSARLKKHNDDLVRSTKHRRPFKLVHSKKFDTLAEARKYEWELKYTPWGGKLEKIGLQRCGVV